MIGCYRKLSRFFATPSGRAVIMPLDGGVSEGMSPGFDDLPGLIGLMRDLPVQGVLLNKGAARAYLAEVPVLFNAVVQLSAGTRHGVPAYAQGLVCSVAEAMRLGADMVAVRVNIANDMEDRFLADMGAVVDEAHGVGLPVLALIRPMGERIVNETDPSLVSHCIRLGAELGADMTGVPYSGDAESFSRACAASSAPVVITGGPVRAEYGDFLNMVSEALAAGAMGTCVSHSILRQPDQGEALRRFVEMVHATGPKAVENAVE